MQVFSLPKVQATMGALGKIFILCYVATQWFAIAFVRKYAGLFDLGNVQFVCTVAKRYVQNVLGSSELTCTKKKGALHQAPASCN